MSARDGLPDAVASLQAKLEVDDMRAEPNAADVTLRLDAGQARVTLSLTGDAAIDLANQLIDAVDQLDGRCQ